jgi:hypothetical protein
VASTGENNRKLNARLNAALVCDGASHGHSASSSSTFSPNRRIWPPFAASRQQELLQLSQIAGDKLHEKWNKGQPCRGGFSKLAGRALGSSLNVCPHCAMGQQLKVRAFTEKK